MGRKQYDFGGVTPINKKQSGGGATHIIIYFLDRIYLLLHRMISINSFMNIKEKNLYDLKSLFLSMKIELNITIHFRRKSEEVINLCLG